MTEDPQECSSIRKYHEFSLSTYTQRVSLAEDMPNYCGCKGFEFRQRCKHITEAEGTLCAWTSQTSDLKQTPQEAMSMVCPSCAEETILIMSGDTAF